MIKVGTISNRSLFRRLFFLAALVGMVSPIAISSENREIIVQQVDSSAVGNCKFIADVQGFSGWGKVAVTVWKNKAKRQALRQASRLDATHIVWTRLPSKYGSPYAYGKVYNCSTAVVFKN